MLSTSMPGTRDEDRARDIEMLLRQRLKYQKRSLGEEADGGD